MMDARLLAGLDQVLEAAKAVIDTELLRIGVMKQSGMDDDELMCKMVMNSMATGDTFGAKSVAAINSILLKRLYDLTEGSVD
jgi:hypothetical protein